jgi:hypothetical protein
VKKLAETAANVAAPPNTFLRVFFGVLIVSNAVDPKTVSMCFYQKLSINPLLTG